MVKKVLTGGVGCPVKPKGVWLSGLCSLALLCAAGLYVTLPQIEKGVQTRVDTALKTNGITDVKATVSGQSVTLTPIGKSPETEPHLAQAKAAILNMHDALIHDGRLPGGQMVNGVVTDVAVNDAGPTTQLAAIPAWPAPSAAPVDASVAPPEVAGEKATTIASSSAGTPPVAGEAAVPASDAVPLSPDAQACQDQVTRAMAGRRIHFVTGTYDLAPDAQPLLDDVYRAIETCPQTVKIDVAGYTDNAGDPEAKQIISKTRAETAADALVKRGLASARVSAEGYGAASPIADNATPQGRLLNQRVTIRVRSE